MSMSMPTLSVRCQTYALHLTHTASWPPTRSGELFDCKHPDNRPVYAERVVRLPRIRLKLPFPAFGAKQSHQLGDASRASDSYEGKSVQ
jgi:hypothetical protein